MYHLGREELRRRGGPVSAPAAPLASAKRRSTKASWTRIGAQRSDWDRRRRPVRWAAWRERSA